MDSKVKDFVYEKIKAVGIDEFDKVFFYFDRIIELNADLRDSEKVGEDLDEALTNLSKNYYDKRVLSDAYYKIIKCFEPFVEF